VRVRRATLEDRPAIFAFIKKAYEGRWQFKIPERWQWEFVANPFLLPGELPVWIAVSEDGAVVGQIGALVEPLKLGARTLRAGWGVDAYVGSAFRGQGIAHRLSKMISAAHEVHLGMNLAPAMRRIRADLGSVPIEPVATYLRPYPLARDQAASALPSHIASKGSSLEKTLTRLLRLTRLDRAVAGAYNRRRSWLDSRTVAAAQRDIAIAKVESFDREADDLWDSVSTNFDALIKRDHVYLNWKYVRQPHIRYERYVARRNGRLCGYIIVRTGTPPEPKIGIVADLFVAPTDEGAMLALLGSAMRDFDRGGVSGVIAATNVRAYEESLLRFGFSKIREDALMVRYNESHEAAPIIRAGRWLLGKADSDWDQYPLAAV
jgi:ribosomal protein S18 acetylase RimI-like enzyme